LRRYTDGDDCPHKRLQGIQTMEDGDAGWVEAVMVSGVFPVRVMGGSRGLVILPVDAFHAQLDTRSARGLFVVALDSLPATRVAGLDRAFSRVRGPVGGGCSLSFAHCVRLTSSESAGTVQI
jgi:hypothetical protein